MLERLFRRAEVPLSMSEGFHPKPRMTFPAALTLGIAGRDEICEVELAAEWTAEEFLVRVTPQLPQGLSFDQVEVLPEGTRKARVRSVTLELPLSEQQRADVPERIDWLMKQDSHVVSRSDSEQQVEVRPYVEQLELDSGVLRMRLRFTQQGTARPREILAALGLDDLDRLTCQLTRTAVDLESEP
jgi:radical SAM-linked protein